MLKKTKYQINKEKIQNDAIKNFCMMTICHMMARESIKHGKPCNDKPIILPREMASVIIGVNIEKNPPLNTKIGSIIGRDLHVY